MDPPSAANPPASGPTGGAPNRFALNGQVWREYDISSYTARRASERRPAQPIVDWILLDTGPETWHGDDVAVLSASLTRLRVFHRPDVQDRVAEIVDRFVRPAQARVSLRLEVVSAADLDWRAGIIHLLKPVAVGAHGQQIWMVAPEDAALIRQQLRQDRRSCVLSSSRLLVDNGTPATVETSQPINYVRSAELANGAMSGYHPSTGQLSDGIRIAMVPLWDRSAAAVDLDLGATISVVRDLHSATASAPLAGGSQWITVQVPEAASSHLQQRVRWPAGQTMIVSLGVHRGLGGPRGGPLAIARTSPATEILIVADLDPAARSPVGTARQAPAPVERRYHTAWQPVSTWRR